MTDFSLFVRHCRQGLLGQDSDTLHRGPGYTAFVGNFISVLDWDHDPAGFEEIAQSLIALATKRKAYVYWRFYDCERNEELLSAISAQGFFRYQPLQLLKFDLADAAKDPPSSDLLQFSTVTTLQDAADLVSIWNRVWPGSYRARIEDLERQLDQTRSRKYLARTFDGLPVAAGALRMNEAPVTILQGGATIPEYRSRGAFSGLVAHRLAISAMAGKVLAFVEAVPDSLPILEKLGFRRVEAGETWIFDARQNHP